MKLTRKTKRTMMFKRYQNAKKTASRTKARDMAKSFYHWLCDVKNQMAVMKMMYDEDEKGLRDLFSGKYLTEGMQK